MKIVIFIQYLLLYPNVNKDAVDGLQKDSRAKIVGGKETTIEKYPFLVSLQQVRFGHFCGGTILTTSWILTAAHCCLMRNRIRDPGCCFIVAGATDSVALSSRSAQLIDIAGFVCHPKYDVKRFSNDIGCIKLKTPMMFSKTVGPVHLSAPYDGDLFNILSSGMVAGWGITEELWYSNNLNEVELPLISQEECNRKVRYPPVRETNVCTMLKYGDLDVCVGDSGGPLLSIYNKTQYAIVSFGRGCANYNNPSVYIRVDKYLDFIKNCVSDLEPFSNSIHPTFSKIIFIVSLLILINYATLTLK